MDDIDITNYADDNTKIFLMTRSIKFFSSTVFQILRPLFFLIRTQSSEGVLYAKLC